MIPRMGEPVRAVGELPPCARRAAPAWVEVGVDESVTSTASPPSNFTPRFWAAACSSAYTSSSWPSVLGLRQNSIQEREASDRRPAYAGSYVIAFRVREVGCRHWCRPKRRIAMPGVFAGLVVGVGAVLYLMLNERDPEPVQPSEA